MPLLAFAIVRVLLGGSPTEGGYGVEMTAGAFPYAPRFADGYFFGEALYRTMIGLGALWLGLYTPPGWYRRALVAVPILLVATWLLSSRIMRVEGLLALVTIPGVLRLLERR